MDSDDIDAEMRRSKWGITPSYLEDEESGSTHIVDEFGDIALLRHYDSYSPACEHPVIHTIVREGGEVLWKQQIEYVADGGPSLQAQEANEKWEEFKKAQK